MKENIKKFIDSKFWKIVQNGNYFEFLHHKSEKPFYNSKPDFLDSAINSSYTFDNRKYEHIEFVLKVSGRLIIEPDYGYVIAGRKIISQSIMYSTLMPSVVRYIKALIKPLKSYEIAIVFDYNAGNNYFHFFSDVFNKLWVLEHFYDLRKTPILIGEELFRLPYFKAIYDTTHIKEYNWKVISKNEYIRVSSAILSRPMPYDSALWLKTKNLIQKEKIVANRKLFLTRSIKTGRFIENLDELLPVLKNTGFEIIDTQGMDFFSQVQLFSSASVIVAIHGAGLTNMVFTSEETKIIEILPENRLACQYYWLAQSLKRQYSPMLGGPLPKVRYYPEGGFYVSRSTIEKLINQVDE